MTTTTQTAPAGTSAATGRYVNIAAYKFISFDDTEAMRPQFQALCQQRQPACTIELLDVGPAVGWISAWTLGGTAVSTAIILRDGDQLTLRSIGPDPARARTNALATIAALVPQIAGD